MHCFLCVEPFSLMICPHYMHSYILCALYSFLPSIMNIWSIFNSSAELISILWHPALRCFRTLALAIVLHHGLWQAMWFPWWLGHLWQVELLGFTRRGQGFRTSAKQMSLFSMGWLMVSIYDWAYFGGNSCV
jgi:hypothetical protein